MKSFTIQSPHTGFMSVYVCREPGQTLQLISEMTELLAAEYEGVESTQIEPESLGLDGLGLDGLDVDFQVVDLNFGYLDLFVTARLIACAYSDQTILVQCQAEDREFDSLEQVFHAMLISMIQSKNEKTSPDPS
jgi:hypothetical protein